MLFTLKRSGFFLISFYVFVSLFALSISPGVFGTEAGPLTFIHKQRSLQPGEVILLEARSSHPLERLSIRAFGRLFPAFALDGNLRWHSLVGIDLETKAGQHEIELNGTGVDGKSVVARNIVTIEAKKFPTRNLTVDSKFVTPPSNELNRINKERARVSGIFSSTTPERLWNGSFGIPVPGEVISAFGKRSVYNGIPRSPHTGTDFRGATGTPIRAPNAGRVVLAANLYYSGNTVILDHGLGLYSYFGHMSAFSAEEGASVQKGEVVGKVGATGRVTGPHLHWTVRLAGSRIDPLSLVNVLDDSGGPESQ